MENLRSGSGPLIRRNNRRWVFAVRKIDTDCGRRIAKMENFPALFVFEFCENVLGEVSW